MLHSLARIAGTQLRIEKELETKPEKALTLVVGGYECYLPLAALVDLDRERARTQTELERLDKEVARSGKLLANQGFMSKVPEAVVQKERDKLADRRDRRAKLEERLNSLR